MTKSETRFYILPAAEIKVDEENRCHTEARLYKQNERVHLAVFADTEVDGSDHDGAEVAP